MEPSIAILDKERREPQSVPEEYHIEASRSLVDRPLRILKHDDLFGVFNQHGDLPGDVQGAEGLYFQDMRFLSRLMLRLGRMSPLLLGSVVLDDNAALIVDLTNADLHDREGRLWLARDSVFLSRQKFLNGNSCYERLLVRRFDPLARSLPLELLFDGDFADLFEVRGERRARRGSVSAAILDSRSVGFLYVGLDEIERRATLYFDPPPAELTTRSARWDLDLSEDDVTEIQIKTACDVGERKAPEPPRLSSAYRAMRRASHRRSGALGRVGSSNALFNEVLSRSASDIDMLLTNTEYGLYPYAGTPWYSTIFGRDGIITALQLMWVAPEIGRGVLEALALTQAVEVDAAADAQPGKIVHEIRNSEMARLGEVPFRRYYGTVDATPLFVMLAGSYLHRTGDLETIGRIWPNIEAALGWIDQYGDSDGDGFVEYRRMTDRGLANQGWKDSFDSIFHSDGRLAEGPIALCEVQAYVFGARQAAAAIARALGLSERSEQLDRQAEALRQRFEAQFWLDDLGTYALALDGAKKPCRVLSSNAGHALFAGIAAPDRARRVAALLTGRQFFSGWGIRTIASGQARYNPMSYHNGSVWPHDNGLIALGLARYGHKAEVARIFQALVEAATYDEFRRLPELFCGFQRRRKRGPTSYPVACSPQAWAAATPFALIAAAGGIDVDWRRECVVLRNPQLPPFLDHMTFPAFEIGESRMKLRLARSGDDVTIAVLERQGPAELIVIK